MAEEKQLKIAGIGELLWDVFGEERQLGGAPANCACHCHQLGGEGYVVSCLGNDESGKAAREFLEKHGANLDGLATSDEHETGIVLVTLDEAGKPDYEIRENVAWDYIPMTDAMAAIASQLDAVAFGTLAQRHSVSRESIGKFLDATKPDCLRMLDINIRQSYYNDEVILASLEKANALKINDEELPLLTRMLGLSGSDEEKMRAILAKFDLKIAILTCGAEGAFMVTADASSFIKPEPIENIASTVGAGDSFTAAALIGYLKNKPLDEINRHANAVASFVCTQTGAVPCLPEKLIQGESTL